MTKTPSIYTAHDTSDLINLVPTLFGFRPTESLVAVATRGPRRRFGFRMRVDVPDPEHVREAALVVVGHLRNQGAEGAILIALTKRQDVARHLLAEIESFLPPIAIIASVRADGSRYWSDEPGFPGEGIPYETSEHHLSIVHAVAAGQQILPDRQALVARFASVAGERRRWLEHATESIIDEVIPQVSATKADELADVGMAVVGPIVARALDGRRTSDADLLRVGVWVSTVSVRDALWAQITPDNAERALQFLTLVSRTVVPPFEPAVLSLAAFAAWLTGDGAQSLIAVERALRADPYYSMATTLLELLQAGVSPAVWGTMSAEDTGSP